MKKLLLFILLIPILGFSQVSIAVNEIGSVESFDLRSLGSVTSTSDSIISLLPYVGTITPPDGFYYNYNTTPPQLVLKNKSMEASTTTISFRELPTKKPYAYSFGYVEYIPHAGTLPLLIVLGGYGENSGDGRSDLYRVLKDGIGDQIRDNTYNQDFITLLPQSGSKTYNVAALRAFVLYAIKTYDVDTTRIYITGLSGGAISLFNYLKTYSCAAAVLCAGSGDYKHACSNAITKTPIWMFHGTNDGTVKPGGDILMLKDYNACSPKEQAKLTLYPGCGHDSWTRTYKNQEVFDWLLLHKTVN